MNLQERVEFVDAIADAAKQLRLAQAAIQRARSLCHAEIYEEVDSMATQLHEMRHASERLQLTVKGRFDFLPAARSESYVAVGERRQGIDRRVMDMRERMFAAPPSA